MQRRIWLVIAVLLGLTALGSTPQVRGAGDAIAPQVVDTVPARGEELPVDSTLTLYFDQAMDRASVESALKVDPDVKGMLNWTNDTTAVFKPAAPLKRDTEYTFGLGSAAKSKAGTPLRDTFTLKLRTPGALEVSQILPADGTQDIEATPTITVIFNRPVVPLLTIEEMAKLPSPLTISPAVEGQGEWLNTSIYTFKPKPGLAGGTKYTITIKKGLTDVSGSVLANDVTATFTTVGPRVISILPETKSPAILRDPAIIVTFSQPMDTKATESAFSLKPVGSATALTGAFTWNTENTVLTFKPALLDYSKSYEIRIDKATARSSTSGLIQADARSTFSTIDTPEIVGTAPKNGDEAQPYGGFGVSFSAPMKFDDFKKRVIVEPKPELYYDDYITQAKDEYRIGFGPEPSTSYKVTIDTNGLVDIYGTPIKLDPKSNLYTMLGDGKIQIHYTTSGYPPEASLKTGSYIGLYSAYRALTRVYSTHRNISSLELSLYSMRLNDFLNLASSNSYEFQNKYQPSDFLRRWTMPVANQPNILRYDLLTVSTEGPSLGQAQNVVCPGAPASQIKVGEIVTVLVDTPTPQRIRDSAALVGNVVGQVKRGTDLTVIGGPLCADRFVWWQVASADGKLQGWTAEGDRSRYFIGPKGGAAKPTQAATQEATLQATPQANADAQAKPMKPGLYYLEFSAPELPSDQRTITHVMVVATANLTLKLSERQAIAWVTDLQSGKPVANVDVKFYGGEKHDEIGTAKTDSDGLATYSFAQPLQTLNEDLYAVVNDGTNFAVGTSNWSDGIDPWAFNLQGDFYPQDVSVYMYTERALYRPGQPVYFRGVLRSRNDMTYSLSDLKTMPVEIFDNEGKSVYSKDVPLTPFGTFADSFNIDPNAPLGYYRIVARPFGKPDDTQNNVERRKPEFSQNFNVADYRLPEFQVKTNAEQSQVLQGDKIKVTVDSSFFFGGAVSNANVSWTVNSNEYSFPYKGTGSYSFIDYNEDAGFSSTDNTYGSVIAEGKGKTDAQGKFVIEVPADLGKTPRSQSFTISASVTDESDQQVSGSADVVVHQGQFYIGITPEEYVGTAKQPQKIDLINVDWDSKPVAGNSISIKVVERVWSSVQTVEPGTGLTVWNYDVKENPVTDGIVQIGQDGKGVYEFTPPAGGIYKIYATSRDSKGNQITSSTFDWVAGPDYVPWRQQNNNRIDLKIDKDSYQIGETASLLIASPFQGEAVALVSVERGHVIKTELVTMKTNSTVYKLPITPDMAPNAFVSVMVVKGVDDKNPVAAFRMGLVQVGVQTDRLKLNITLTPDKPQAGPRDKVNYKVHVTDYAGKPVQAEVGLALVDQAALSLLADQSAPILQYFYGTQGLGVRTSSTLTLSVDQQTQQILNTVKGGGGGGPEGGVFEVRQEFVTTPLWSPAVNTDANGDAIVSVTLPDNLTTWRLDARAVTKPIGELSTTLVGQTTIDLLSTKPLLIRPVTPRFYVVGDVSTLAAVVNNNTDQSQDVTVRIDAQGVTLKGDATLKGTIPSKGRARFEWPVEVKDVDNVGVTFFASSADNKYTDAAKSAVGQGADKTLPVVRYEVPETVGTGGVIDQAGGNSTEGILLSSRLNVTQGTLAIRVDPSLAATATDALNVLKNYPYQCLEQTVSRFLPNLMTYRALKQLGLDDPKMKSELGDVINYAVQRLYAEQHTDGGWGWFVRDNSDALVTAYAVIGLSEAQQQGFDVDKDVLAKAIAFVQKQLKPLGDQANTWQLNRQAFLLYALARAKSGNVAQSVRLFNIREKLSVYARAYLAMTFHLLDSKETRYTAPLISDLQNRAVASATGMHWEEDYNDYYNWNTDTRTTAIALNALVEIDPTNKLIPNVVRWLMIARKADAWETTQETAWAVMGLTDWMQVTGELKPNYSFDVTINDKALTTGQKVTPDTVKQHVDLQVAVKDLLIDEVNKLVITRSSGDGVLYYTAHLTAYVPVEQVKPVSRGMSITRTYSLQSDPDRKPIKEAHVGDVIRVTLDIVATNDLNYVVINDPIPAGAEAIDPNLDTSGTVGQEPDLRLNDPLSTGWGWWWFSNTELRDDRTVLYATYLPQGTYQFTYSIRAGLAGQYRVIPATGQEFYFPEVYGRSGGSLFTLLPATKEETLVIPALR
ncbi:MAG: Ig-like domain-containing protein [Chloroflexota bacterium]